MALDEMDLKILRAMQRHPDLSGADLSDLVGLSHTPCWRRLKRLESEGYILRRAILLDAKKLGFGVDVFASLRLRQHDEDTLEALEGQVLRHPEIVECFSMSGDGDYLLRVVARSIDDYERFLKKVLLHLPGVGSINSSFALNCIKMATELPI